MKPLSGIEMIAEAKTCSDVLISYSSYHASTKHVASSSTIMRHSDATVTLCLIARP
jgi:hypothetical protein